jgi:hypothetical protein
VACQQFAGESACLPALVDSELREIPHEKNKNILGSEGLIPNLFESIRVKPMPSPGWNHARDGDFHRSFPSCGFP